MAEPTAFDQKNPPKSVTDPRPEGAVRDAQYPRHLHRADGEYCVVTTDAECAAKQADGWYLSPADAKAAAAEPAQVEAPKRGRPAKDAA